MHQQGCLGTQMNAEIMQLDNHPFAAHAQHHQRDNQPWQKAQGLFINLRHRLEHAHQQADQQAWHHQYRNQQNHYFYAAGDNVGGNVYGQHNQPSPSPRMLVVSVPMVSDQPSISTNSISLKGSETISGDSIIIPIAINTLATIGSITRNGM